MIPSDFIEDLLSKIDIVDVISRYLNLKKSGQNYVVNCPFHKEKTPSFTVSPTKQFYHCFGCGASGTAITFLMKYSGLSFVESIKNLSNDAGLTLPVSYVNYHDEQKINKIQEKRQNLEQFMQKISFFYSDQLKNNAFAQEYLLERGLNKDICEKFLIGYSPNIKNGLSKIFNPYPNDDLIQSGMIKQSDNKDFYDHFRGRIMFPIRNLQNKILGFGGRVLDNTLPKYLNSPETILFDKSKILYGLYESRAGIRDNGKIIVVEGYIDVISLFQHGISYAVATLGTSTSSEHIKILFRQSDKIYFCFDGDKAGRQAAWKAVENSLPLLTEDKSIYFLFLEEGYDPDSYIRKNGKEQFETLLNNNSVILSQYLLDYLSFNLNLDFEEDKSKLIKNFSNLILQVKNFNLRFFLTKKLSSKLNISFDNLQVLLNSNSNFNKVSYGKNFIENKFNNLKISTSIEKLILWLLINPQLAKYIDIPEFITLDEEMFALVGLSQSIKSLKNYNTAQVIEQMRGSNFYDVINKIFIDAKDLINEFNVISIDDEKAFLDGLQKVNDNINLLQLQELKDLMKIRDLTTDENKLLLYLSKRNFKIN